MASDGDVVKKLDDTFHDAPRRQLETLAAILERNGGVSYLQPYLGGFYAPVDAATFRRAVPLSSYDDYSDHIGKLADGVLVDDRGQPLLSVDPLLCFFYSSGTSSMRPKLIPYFDSKAGRAASSLAHQATGAILRRFFPPRTLANKALGFLYAGNVTQTKGGFKAMAATAFPLQTNNPNASQFLSAYISPKEVITGTDVRQQMYCHLLCGLRHFDVIDGIRAPYAAGLIKAFTLLESHWEKLSEDLKNGFPSFSEITDSSMRQSVTSTLGRPRPDLSERVRLICGNTSWEGIVSKLWPNVRYVKCVLTGSMAQYYMKLKYYSGEKISLIGSDYFASECCVAINLDLLQPPELTRYVLLPTAAYFEFIPFDHIATTSCVRDKKVMDMSCLEVGEMYEVVVTTFRGFYRLRLGDVVRVVGFHDTSPLVEFVMRAPKNSNQIITERDLSLAMAGFEDDFGGDVVEFAGFLDSEFGLKPNLKVFVEVKDVSVFLRNNDEFAVPVDARTKCCTVLEGGLGGVYKVMKERGEIGPLSVSIVRSGGFDGLLEEAIRNGAPASQYKPPKIITNGKVVDYLEASSIATFSSFDREKVEAKST